MTRIKVILNTRRITFRERSCFNIALSLFPKALLSPLGEAKFFRSFRLTYILKLILSYAVNFFKTMVQLCPPKPRELLMAALTVALRASLGT